MTSAELSMGWLDSRVGSRFGRDFSVFGGLGWVHDSRSTKIGKDCVKARLDKIWLHQTVKFVSCIGLDLVVRNFPLVVGWVGLGHSADGLGWIGSHRIDPRTTLH